MNLQVFDGIRTGQPDKNAPSIQNTPPRNLHFEGRDEQLVALHTAILAETAATVYSLHGLGGVGKTQLAVEYCHRYSAEYQIIWWVPAQESSLIPDRLVALAAALNIPTTDPNTAVQKLVDHLRVSGRWLLVFDNAENPGDIRRFVPPGQGHVLVTTRSTQFGSIGHEISVDVFERAVSVDFLQRRAGVPANIGNELAGVLGDLPLALEQAAAYLKYTRMDSRSYLQIWRSRSEDLLAKGEVIGYEHTLATVWDITVERLGQDHPAALEILRILAFVESFPFPLFLFTYTAETLEAPLREAVGDEIQWADSLAALTKFSLCDRPLPEAVVVHRLVQTVTRHKLGYFGQRYLAMALRILLNSAPKDVADEPGEWPWWSLMMLHVFAVTGHRDAMKADGSAVVMLLNRAGEYMRVRGRPIEARDILQKALRLADSADLDVNKSSLLNDYARALESIGAVGEAELAYRRAISIEKDQRRARGIKANLALLLDASGEFAEALTIMQECYESVVQEHGPDSTEAVSTGQGLAAVLISLRRYSEAKLHIERAHQVLYGPDHSNTEALAKHYNNRAALTLHEGDSTSAAALFRKALSIGQAVHGIDHPTVIATMSNLGTALRAEGQCDEAAALLRQALPISEAITGPDSHMTFAVVNNLAATVRQLGDLDRGVDLYRRALGISQRTYGEDSPHVARSLSNMAVALAEAGNPQSARAYMSRAIKITEGAYGPESSILAERLTVLAAIYQNLGQDKQSRRLAIRAARMLEKIDKENPLLPRLRETLDE